MPLYEVMNLSVGQTIIFERTGNDPVKLRAGSTDLTEGVMGHIGKNVSVRVSRPLNPPRVTMAVFDALDEHLERNK